jgi:hypothetical protein
LGDAFGVSNVSGKFGNPLALVERELCALGVEDEGGVNVKLLGESNEEGDKNGRFEAGIGVVDVNGVVDDGLDDEVVAVDAELVVGENGKAEGVDVAEAETEAEAEARDDDGSFADLKFGTAFDVVVLGFVLFEGDETPKDDAFTVGDETEVDTGIEEAAEAHEFEGLTVGNCERAGVFLTRDCCSGNGVGGGKWGCGSKFGRLRRWREQNGSPQSSSSTAGSRIITGFKCLILLTNLRRAFMLLGRVVSSSGTLMIHACGMRSWRVDFINSKRYSSSATAVSLGSDRWGASPSKTYVNSRLL